MIVKQQPRKSESPETQRWPRNGQNAKVEASSSCLAMGTLEAAERHKPKYWGHRNGKAGQRAFHWGSVNLRLRPHLSYSSQARKTAATTNAVAVLGLTDVYVGTGGFHSMTPQCQYRPYRGTSSFGCPWSCTVGPKGGRCSQTLLEKKLPDQMKTKDASLCSKTQSLFQACKTQREKKLLGNVIKKPVILCINWKKKEAPLCQTTCKSRIPDETFSKGE